MSGPPISVRGGPAGIAAHLEDLTRLAARFGSQAGSAALRAAGLHTLLVEPAVLSAAVLDPVGGVQFAARLVDALDGPRGLVPAATGFAAFDAQVRAAAVAYRAADALDRQVAPVLDGVGGVGAAVLAAAPGLRHGDVGGAVLAAGAADPQALDWVVDAATRFWTRHGLMLLAATYPDGRARVSGGDRDRDPAAVRPPRGVQDLLDGLAHRNDGPGGAIDVRIITSTGPDRLPRRHVVVDLPGTKTWAPYSADVTSLGTNLRSVTGAVTTYEAGVLIALRRAGVRPSDPILFVGHSQGGLVALDTARRLAAAGRLRVAGVITAGSPIGRIPVPRSMPVLALENAGDVIPHCDGADNPDRPNVTTVTIGASSANALTNHELRTGYLPAGATIDASGDRSVRATLEGWRGFFDGTTVSTAVYEVTRR